MPFSNTRLTPLLPPSYIPPRFPSLYWPINPPPHAPRYLYYPTDIFRFTLFWTLLCYAACFVVAGVTGWVGSAVGARYVHHYTSEEEEDEGSVRRGAAKKVRRKKKTREGHKWWWGAGWLVGGVVIGGVEAAVAGSVVGAILAAVYNAGYCRMSTWIPMVWGVINILMLILSSYSQQGGL